MTSAEAITYKNVLVRDVFGSLSIDKSRLPASGLTSLGVPSFVAEWLLDKIVPGTGALTSAESEKVNSFVQKAFPRKDDKEEIKFRLTQGEIYKLIGLIKVRIKLEKAMGAIPEPLAHIPILNLEECQISTELVDRYKMLLRQGIWGKISLAIRPEGQIEVIDFDPFQCSKVDLKAYAECRTHFNTDEWRDLMFCSMGFNPEHLSYNQEAKTWVLARLLPLVEPNYHMMELAPKGRVSASQTLLTTGLVRSATWLGTKCRYPS